MASALTAPHFQNAEKARLYLEAQVWPNGPICPHCGVIGGHYKLEGKTTRPGLYKCKDCREPFTVTVGTVFERSKIALNVWLMAVHLICSSKKGMSAHQLHRTLGVSYKTAWFMAHRIREAFKVNHSEPMGGYGKVVEADETFWGNTKMKSEGYRGAHHKMKVFALVERNGGARSFVVPSVNAATLKPILKEQVNRYTHIMTDDGHAYKNLTLNFLAHDRVNHSKGEYVRGKATTNTVEGYFSILKRGLIGTFHHVGEQHLQRYVTEFDFRYSNRSALGVSDAQRMDTALKGIKGKRLTYRRIGEA